MTSPLSHVSSTTIILHSHKRVSLPLTSLYHISSATKVIICHITTSPPPPLLPLLTFYLIVPRPPPPPSLSRISTTSIAILMRLHRRPHYPMNLIDILCPFLMGKNLSRNDWIATRHRPQLQPRLWDSPYHALCFIWSGLITTIQYDCSILIAPLCSSDSLLLIWSSLSLSLFFSAPIPFSHSTLLRLVFLCLPSLRSVPICSTCSHQIYRSDLINIPF